MTKPSFGNGYGLNRETGGHSSLPAAVPPLGHTIIKPGVHNSKKHFQGAKILNKKPGKQ